MSSSTSTLGSRKPSGDSSSSSRKNKGVRFASGDDDDRPTKRSRVERPTNMDEDDDVDEWINDEVVDKDDVVVPSERELVDAKRNRRLKRQGQDGIDDDNEETHVDKDTSLMEEQQQRKNSGDGDDDDGAIPVEPFNMNAERTDGSGYFEGDTYVFRKRDEEGEPDAWLDSLNNDNDDKKGSQKIAKPRAAVERKQRAMDDWTKDELYATLLPLVSSDTESVLQALVRYGDLIKRQTKAKNEAALTLSQTALNQLTEASNALLLQGDVDIYQKTRQDIMKMVPDPPKAAAGGKAVQWEYKGNQDGQIHGPYSTAEMLGWTQAGYFIGAQAVQIRTVQKGDETAKTTAEDLLSDLMDDDDDDEGEKPTEPVRGEWQSSNDVNFKAYS